MEHQRHSTGNHAPSHQTFTTSASTPSFRVYADMRSEQFANGEVVYTSADSMDKPCIDSMRDDFRYRFNCRCGCGSQFSILGEDIKAAAKNNRRPNQIVVLNDQASAVTGMSSEALINSLTKMGTESESTPIAWRQESTTSAEAEAEAETTRPFVSDRFLKKAEFGLSDDEIDAYHEDHPDDLEAKGVKLSERQPPAIGDLVYSLSTNDGPFSLLDYVHREVTINSGGGTARVLCALVRNTKGAYYTLPLADLALDYEDRPVKPSSAPSWITAVLATTSAVIGSAIALGFFYF